MIPLSFPSFPFLFFPFLVLLPFLNNVLLRPFGGQNKAASTLAGEGNVLWSPRAAFLNSATVREGIHVIPQVLGSKGVRMVFTCGLGWGGSSGNVEVGYGLV